MLTNVENSIINPLQPFTDYAEDLIKTNVLILHYKVTCKS